MSLYSAYVKPDQAVRVAEAIVDSMDPIDWRKVIELMSNPEQLCDGHEADRGIAGGFPAADAGSANEGLPPVIAGAFGKSPEVCRQILEAV